MAKPETAAGYEKKVTENCERLLVTLIRNLGPWKKSIYLVGGLTPRYLVTNPPEGKPHAGTGDVDVVVEQQVLADTDAYRTLEDNLKKMGFTRATNDKGQPQSWRWQAKTDSGGSIVLEFLADDPKRGGGKVAPLPTEGNISALNIPHASLVFDHFEVKEIAADLLGDKGVATEEVRHADIVSFTCLKAYALTDRHEGKDAHDILYCLEHAEGGIATAAEKFKKALEGKHAEVVKEVLAILRKHFVTDDKTEGYRKDGSVAVAQFEIEDGEPNARERRSLRAREASELVTNFIDTV
ncbi:antitoxin [Bradyrhizobium sp. 930_D9_N1_4]|uniref:antitoxin n=1 Tax=Bradyrhizobium sp. 930_D9_N1_4 TaxID=3240374 RepID=UPI003F897BBD